MSNKTSVSSNLIAPLQDWHDQIVNLMIEIEGYKRNKGARISRELAITRANLNDARVFLESSLYKLKLDL